MKIAVVKVPFPGVLGTAIIKFHPGFAGSGSSLIINAKMLGIDLCSLEAVVFSVFEFG